MSGKFSYGGVLQLAGLSCSGLVLLASVSGRGPEWPTAVVLITASLAVAASCSRGVLGQLAFTSWILVGVCVGLAWSSSLIRFPDGFWRFGGQETSVVFIPLLQLIMFAMGTTLSVADFHRVLQMPTGVVIGLVCQFTLMPLTGYVLAYSFGLPPEIAAGLILVGSSPGGLASNVMVFIARANVALSVTMTACSTLAAPIVTPLLMQLLADELVQIDVSAMMWSMTKIVLLPVLAGLVFHHVLFQRLRWLGRVMPIVSMVGILIMTVLTVAAGRDRLIEVGGLLIVACILHSTAGFVLGYAVCRLLRRDVQTCRTIALEVRLQNAGMATGLAKELGKVATLGLVPIVFGPVMNVIASVLANWWRGNPAEDAVGVD